MDEVDLGEFIFSEDYHKLEGCYLITSRDYCYNTFCSEIETYLGFYDVIIESRVISKIFNFDIFILGSSKKILILGDLTNVQDSDSLTKNSSLINNIWEKFQKKFNFEECNLQVFKNVVHKLSLPS